jgi:integrase
MADPIDLHPSARLDLDPSTPDRVRAFIAHVVGMVLNDVNTCGACWTGCPVRFGLRVPRRDAAFRDFDAYERLLAAAQEFDHRSYVIALLGGEAGLRAGEIVALEWADVDLDRRQICVPATRT